MGKEIGYDIRYLPSVLEKDVPALDTFWRGEVERAILTKLTTSPEMYGMPLRQDLKGLWKLRVGAYRIVYRIEKRMVRIVIIDHRSTVYTEAFKRLIFLR